MYYLDLGKWVFKLINTYRSYENLLNFVNDQDAFNTHFNNKVVYKYELENFEIISMNDYTNKKYFEDSIKETINEAIDNYSNQMIVILAAYIETIQSEFFKSLFYRHNSFIYDFISNNSEQKGYVHLNMILDSESKDEILDKLIYNAIKNITNGSLKKINERVLKITKYQIDTNLSEDIQKRIINKRNDIVHESKSIVIDDDEIKSLFDLAEKYLIELGYICKKANIPYLDQSDLLNK